MPDGVGASGDEFVELARAYKRINAPLGELGMATLKISTTALAGDDKTYNNLENRLQLITVLRDALAARMLDRLTDAEFHGKRISGGEERALVFQADSLVNFANELASSKGSSH